MNQLKFSHNYLKLPPNWEGKKATLLFVREIELGKQNYYFLELDTSYEDPENIETREWSKLLQYPLPKKGKYLLLLFECEGTVFTTLRRSYESKLTYYGTRVGEEFELVKTDDK